MLCSQNVLILFACTRSSPGVTSALFRVHFSNSPCLGPVYTSLLWLLWLHICICLKLIQLGSHAVLTTCNHGFPTTIFLLPYHQVHLAVCTTRLRTRYVQMLWQVDTRQMLAAGVNHACVALHLRIADISSFTFHNNNCFFLFIGNFIWKKL